MSSVTIAEITDGVFGYGGKPVFGPVNLTVDQGEFILLVGPNGSGKSTLLSGLLGLISPMEGTVRPIHPRRLGYVPQVDRVNSQYPVLVKEFVLMGCYPGLGLRWAGAGERRKVEGVLSRLELGALASMPFSSLSKGQKQQVMLARALVDDPSVLVLDEPTSAVDCASEARITERVAEVNADHGATVLVVTHSPDAFRRHATAIWSTQEVCRSA